MQQPPGPSHGSGYEFLSDTVTPSRRPSVSSIRSLFLTAPPVMPTEVNPPPTYVAVAAASQIVSDYQKAQLRERFGDGVAQISPDDVALFSDGALAMVNAFLDYLLHQFLSSAGSTSLQSLRPAINDILKRRLAREAIASAEEELQELLGGGEDEEEQTHPPNGTQHAQKWDLEMVWKRTRLRVMVYIRLGEMEDEDEERYVEQEHLVGPEAGNRRSSSTIGLVSWAAAIFLTSVIEYLAEQTLLAAGQAAYERVLWKRIDRDETIPPSNERLRERVVVEDFDAEKVALNPALGRLWRTWRNRLRTLAVRPPAPSSRASTLRASSSHAAGLRSSAATTDGSVYSQTNRSRQSSVTGNSEVGTTEQQQFASRADQIVPRAAGSIDDARTSRKHLATKSTEQAGNPAAVSLNSIASVSAGSAVQTTLLEHAHDDLFTSGRRRSRSLPSEDTAPFPSTRKQLSKDSNLDAAADIGASHGSHSTDELEGPRQPENGHAEVDSVAAGAAASILGHDENRQDPTSLQVERERRKSVVSTTTATGDEEEPEVLETVRMHLRSPQTPTEVVQTLSRASSSAKSFSLRAASPAKLSGSSGPLRHLPSSPPNGYLAKTNSSPRGEYFGGNTLPEDMTERQVYVTRKRLQSGHVGAEDPAMLGSVALLDNTSKVPSSLSSHAGDMAQFSRFSTPAAPPSDMNGRSFLQSPLTDSFPDESHANSVSASIPQKNTLKTERRDRVTEFRPQESASLTASIAAPVSMSDNEEDDAPKRTGPTFLNYGEPDANSMNRMGNVARSDTPLTTTPVHGGFAVAIDKPAPMSGTEALLSAHLPRQTHTNNQVQQSRPTLDDIGPDRLSPKNSLVSFSDQSQPPIPSSNGGRWVSQKRDKSSPRVTTDSSMSARDSTNRSSVQHSRAGKAREPTVLAESTRDFADFIRSTGPDRGHIITPINNSSAVAQKVPYSAVAASVQQRSGQYSETVKAWKDRAFRSSDADAQGVPARTKFDVREPTLTDGGSADLIDFIRTGPPGRSGQSRLRSQDEVRVGEAGKALHAAPQNPTSTSHSRPAEGMSFGSARESPMLSGSGRTSANSRTVLLPSVTEQKVTQPAYATSGSKELAGPRLSDPDEPVRRRRRVRDPYAIDTDDEDEDFLTALPRSRAGRQEESLMDFLRDVEPPSMGGKASSRSVTDGRPIHPDTDLHGAAVADAASLSRRGYASASGSSSAATGGPGETASAAAAASRRFASPMGGISIAQRGPSYESGSKSTSSRMARSKFVARSAGNNNVGGASAEATHTGELAEFLRTSGPVGKEGVASPTPVVKQEREAGSVKSGKGGAKGRTKFWKKKTYLDMP